jgi:exosortase D (VPLPA-CTERM-specific)
MTARTADRPASAPSFLWISFAVATVLCAMAFSGGLFELVRRWSTQDEYNHGFLVPVIAAWLLWQRRAALLEACGQPHWAGPLLVAVSIVMLVVGELTAVFLLLQVGFLVALAGMVAAIGGLSLLRVAALPIAFLIFAIPLPYFIDAMLSWRLQLVSSRLGVWLLQLFAVPVYLEGNMIDLGVYKIQVVDACSGLRYLYPFLSLSFLAAYLFRAPLWQKCLVVISTLPITIFMNSARIGMTGIAIHQWGTGIAEGFLHLFEGWVIFVVCALALWLEVWALARISGRSFFASWGAAPPLTYAVSQTTPQPFDRRTVLAFGALIAAIPTVFLVGGREELVPHRERFVSFPRSLGPWKGELSYLEPQIEHGLGLTDYILADFRNGNGPPVNLYIAYYESQRKGVSPHSPSVCIPGGGWLITKLDRINVALDGRGAAMPVNRVVISRNSYHQLVYYWFDERGRKISSEWLMKWYLLVDALLERRTDGALVRLTTQIPDDEDASAADARLVSMMQDLAPVISRYLPR